MSEPEGSLSEGVLFYAARRSVIIVCDVLAARIVFRTLPACELIAVPDHKNVTGRTGREVVFPIRYGSFHIRFPNRGAKIGLI